jgi:hypothetical protein
VIVAVLLMRMVQVAVDQIVHVVSVHNPFVPAVRSMNVIGLMSPAPVVRRAASLVICPYFQLVFVHMIPVHMMEMTIVEIIGMAVVSDCGVATIRAMDMSVPFLFHTRSSHDKALLYRIVYRRR